MIENKPSATEKTKRSEISTTVEVHLPECVQIDLVQANELRHYEIFLWIGSLFASASAGFWTAFATTSPNSKILLLVSLVFTLFTGVFIWAAFHYRSRLKSGGIIRKVALDKFN